MTIDEQIGALFSLARENSEGIKDLLNTSKEHSQEIKDLLDTSKEHGQEIKDLLDTSKEHGQEIKDLLNTSKEQGQEIKDLLDTSREHTKQLELDGLHIKQLAMIVQDHHAELDKLTADVTRMTNGIQALLEMSGLHETRLNLLEGGHA